MASVGPQASRSHVCLLWRIMAFSVSLEPQCVCGGGVVYPCLPLACLPNSAPDHFVFRACPSFHSGSPRKRVPCRPPGWALPAVLGTGTSKASERTPMVCDAHVFLTLPARHGSTKAPFCLRGHTDPRPLSETMGVRSHDQATSPGPWWGWVNMDRFLVSLAVQPCWHLFYLSLPPSSSSLPDPYLLWQPPCHFVA